MTKEWYPVIDDKKCSGCLTCFNFCLHGVFEEKDGKPVVKNKEACIDMCKGCAKICSEKAIKFP